MPNRKPNYVKVSMFVRYVLQFSNNGHRCTSRSDSQELAMLGTGSQCYFLSGRALKAFGLFQLALLLLGSLAPVSAIGYAGDGKAEMGRLIDDSKQRTSVHIVVVRDGTVPQNWTFTVSPQTRSFTVTATEKQLGRTQRFDFPSEWAAEARLSASKLPTQFPSTAVAIHLDHFLSFIVFDPELDRFVVVTSQEHPKIPLRLLEPEIEASKSGKLFVVERSGGNAVGSVTCWQPNAKSTALKELVRVDIATDDRGNRFEFPERRVNGRFRRPRLRYLPSHWWNTTCKKLLQVS